MESEGRKENRELGSRSTPLIVPLPIRPFCPPQSFRQWTPYNHLLPAAWNFWPVLDPLYSWRPVQPRTGLSGPVRSRPPIGVFHSKAGRVAEPYGYKCSHCQAVLDSPGSFHAHLRTHMTSSCHCPICGKTFSRHWLLQGHIRTHTGEKPFQCPVCSKAFADKSNLRAHIQTHSGAKPYSCPRCGKAFALKSYLSKHEESACFKFKAALPISSKSGKASSV